MGLFTALYKVIIWIARSALLVMTVLFLSAFLSFSGKK